MPWDFWLIFVVFGIVIPWRSRVRLRRLLALPAMSTKEKLVLYGTTIAFQWVLLGLVAWRAQARGLTAAQLGLELDISGQLLFFGVAGAALLGSWQWFNLRRVSRMTGAAPDFLRKLAESIMPNRTVEFAPYCALAITAGVCEEFLYRGFAMAALSRAGIASWGGVVITAVLFGFAHTYQGKSGIVGTILMGLVFGAFRVAFESLLPIMVWHAAVDLVAGVAGPRYLLQSQKAD